MQPRIMSLRRALIGMALGVFPLTAAAEDEPKLPTPTPAALLQVWGTLYDQDVHPITDPASYGDPEDDPGFKVRRARIGLGGQEDGMRYDLTFGFSSGFDAVGGPPDEDIQLISASGGVKVVPKVWIDAGVVKVPTSRSFLMSAGELALGDRPVGSNVLVPAREVGVLVDGRVGDRDGFRGRARLGAFNGNGSLIGDDNNGKMVAGRIEGIVGPADTYKTYGTVESATFAVAVDAVYSVDLATTRAHYGGDVLVRVGGLAALAEVHYQLLRPADADLDLPGTLADTPRLGTVVQVGYTVDQYEPVLRFSTINDHLEFEDNGDVGVGEAGFVWHGENDAIRAGAVYVSRLELAGQATKNDSARLWMQMRL